MANPLDLFSEDTPNRHSSQLIRPSSPIQETETLKELKLIELQKELLKQRNTLKEDVQRLEREWNDMRSNVDVDENNEEDDAIFELLIQKANEEENTIQNQPNTTTIDDNDADDLDNFSAKPSKNWDLRIEYLQKFYPDVSITNHSSKVSLEYNDPTNPKKSQFIKTIAFALGYTKNIIRLEVQVKLTKVDNIYKIHDLIISRKSNNRLNTILIIIIDHFSQTKNVNEFLYTINKLYKTLNNRQETLNNLNDKYGNPKSNIYENEFKYKDISLLWDLIFENGELKSLINVNDAYNDVFNDLTEHYGVQRGTEQLIATIYPEESKEVE